MACRIWSRKGCLVIQIVPYLDLSLPLCLRTRHQFKPRFETSRTIHHLQLITDNLLPQVKKWAKKMISTVCNRAQENVSTIMETRTSVPLVERGILKRTKKRAVIRQQRRRVHWRNAAMAIRCRHQILQSLFQPSRHPIPIQHVIQCPLVARYILYPI